MPFGSPPSHFLLDLPSDTPKTPEEHRDNGRKTREWANQSPFMFMFGTGVTAFSATQLDQNQTPHMAFLCQAGSDPVGFIGGSGRLNYPQSFKNEILAWNGNSSMDGFFGVALSIPTQTGDTLAGIDLLAQDLQSGGGVGAVNGTVVISWIAVGW